MMFNKMRIYPFVFLMTLICLAFPDDATAQTPVQMRYVMKDKQRYFLLNDVAKYYNMNFSFTKTGAVIYNKNNRIDFTYNKRSGGIDGVTVYFLTPIYIVNGRAYLSELDFKTVLEPVFGKKKLVRHNLKTIMIDPGHGGKDKGASGPVLDEKTINLMIAKKLRDALKAKGFNVITLFYQ